MARKIDDDFFAAAQIDADDVAEAAAMGIALIVNNRPDGEDPDAPQSAQIAAAAASHGLGYVAIPVTHAGFSHAQIDALQTALAGATGPVLAYCRSGTRSTNLWALTRARMGDDPDTIVAKAAAAGYDLTALRPMLDALTPDRA